MKEQVLDTVACFQQQNIFSKFKDLNLLCMTNRFIQPMLLIISAWIIISCSSVKVTSNPRNIYFSDKDTLIMAGIGNIKPSFHEDAQQEFNKAFSKCNVAKTINYYDLQNLLIRKTAQPDLVLPRRKSFELLKNLGLSGYIIDASVIDSNSDESLIKYIPQGQSVSQPNQPDPWIKFRFTIYHINTQSLALNATVQVISNTVIVGKNVDTDIGVNKGVNVGHPTHALRKALKKVTKICHCR